MESKIERIGSIGFNRYGSKMIVVDYKSARDVWIQFDKGNPVHTDWTSFSKGTVRNVYDKTVYGVGYIGEGRYKTSENYVPSVQYAIWKDMLARCYGISNLEKNPTYIGCSVAEDWHNFQNFAQWYDENYYKVEGERMELDKDILVKGNKIYSPKTCVYVPHNINTLFVKRNSKRGKLPIGVRLLKGRKKRPFMARCNNGEGKEIFINYFSTPEEAFIAYKEFKEQLIKQIADEYKDKIPNKLYEGMIKYSVEITD